MHVYLIELIPVVESFYIVVADSEEEAVKLFLQKHTPKNDSITHTKELLTISDHYNDYKGERVDYDTYYLILDLGVVEKRAYL